jgi:dipeptide/tripeptide permease
MSTTAVGTPPNFPQTLGHPCPLWMLFMPEFWERFAFYGIRWALVLYIVAQFHGGDTAGELPANRIYGAWCMPARSSAAISPTVCNWKPRQF